MLLTGDMMAIIEVAERLVVTVGFPIVCCGAMIFLNYSENKKHDAETKGFIKAIENNTAAIKELIAYIKKGSD